MHTINADLDLNRVSENLVTRVAAALGVDRVAVFVPSGSFGINPALMQGRMFPRFVDRTHHTFLNLTKPLCLR